MDAVREPEAFPAPAEPFSWKSSPAGIVLVCGPLAQVATHGWSTRQLELHGPESACTAQWGRLAAAAHLEVDAVRRMSQVHGTTVLPARLQHAAAPVADGLTSDDPSLLPCVRVADCVPVLLADRRTGAVAAVHAGWRGTAAGITGVAVRAMHAEYGTGPADIIAGLGPSIGPCHYEVGAEVHAQFRAAGWADVQLARWFAPAGGRWRLDLARAISDQLHGAGVPPDAIHASGLCTACHPAWFYSYRRDGTGTGRLVGFIRAAARDGRARGVTPLS